MTKAGVIHLTRTIAAELGPNGIRANAVAPGFVETPMTSRVWTKPDGSIDEQIRDQTLALRAGQSPLGIIGTPDDVAWSMLFLAADASRFMTGEVLRPNGGVFMS
jgi:3-oxoacyl-[acyl-carrier protein] reductase